MRYITTEEMGGRRTEDGQRTTDRNRNKDTVDVGVYLLDVIDEDVKT